MCVGNEEHDTVTPPSTADSHSNLFTTCLSIPDNVVSASFMQKMPPWRRHGESLFLTCYSLTFRGVLICKPFSVVYCGLSRNNLKLKQIEMLRKTCVQHVFLFSIFYFLSFSFFSLFFACLQCLLIHEQGTSRHLRTHTFTPSVSHRRTRALPHTPVTSGWSLE